MTEPTAARVRELLLYDPETGLFTWRDLQAGVIRKRRRYEAGGPDGQGYLRISIDGRNYGAHRLAWLYVHGVMPKAQIDHIDGNRTNNRIENLRDVPIAVNRQNQRKAGSHSKTGLLGVCAPTKSCPHYLASITAHGYRMMLGKFPTAELAHAAYMEAKAKYHAGYIEAHRAPKEWQSAT